MADSIRDSIRIRIVTPDSIRYSIRTPTADSQVPTNKNNNKKIKMSSNRRSVPDLKMSL